VEGRRNSESRPEYGEGGLENEPEQLYRISQVAHQRYTTRLKTPSPIKGYLLAVRFVILEEEGGYYIVRLPPEWSVLSYPNGSLVFCGPKGRPHYRQLYEPFNWLIQYF